MERFVKGKVKKIIIIFLICTLMITAFPIPINAENGGEEVSVAGALFKPFAKLLCKIGDLLIQGLQKIFIGGDGSIYEVNSSIDESAIENVRGATSFDNLIQILQEKGYIGTKASGKNYKENRVERQVKKWLNDLFGKSKTERYWRNHEDKFKECINGATDEQIMELFDNKVFGDTGYSIKYSPAIIFSGQVPGFDIDFIGANPEVETEESAENGIIENAKVSSATKLQGVVSKAFQGLQLFAIVGLLSVLVYMAIRIITGSVGQKSKYKQMLMDWLAAFCILFALLYLMAFILNITQSITKVIAASATGIGANGEDIFMSELRDEIGSDPAFLNVFGETVIYLALVFYTCSFTIKYLKRVVQMAFLTMIAPLIALTYPLDKIKDSKAQAFTMWLKEYIFNAMIQPVDFLLYYILLGSSVMLLENNPIYAVVAIGFLTPAEKFFRKMFKMESKTPIGQIGAAAAGATTMNLINQMKSIGKKGSKSNNSGEKSEKEVRTVINPLTALQGATTNTNQEVVQNEETVQDEPHTVNMGWTRDNSGEDIAQGGGSSEASARGTTRASNSVATPVTTARRSNIASETSPISRTATGEVFRSRVEGATNQNEGTQNQNARTILGVNKGLTPGQMKTVKSCAKLAGKLAGGLAIGTIGVAAGVTSGDFEKTITYMTGGAVAGGVAGGRLGEEIAETSHKIEEALERSQYRHDEREYGREEAQNMKFDREFFNSSEGKELLKQYAQEEIQKCLSAGITEKKKIDKIMKASKRISSRKPSERNPIEKAIAYSHLAEKCENKILEDDRSFIRYLEAHNIPTDNVTEIREGIRDFK